MWQARARDSIEVRLQAAQLRRAKRKVREVGDTSYGAATGETLSRASSAMSVLSSCHPSPIKQMGSGRCDSFLSFVRF